MGIGLRAAQPLARERVFGRVGGLGPEAHEVQHMDRRIARQRLEGVELRALGVDMPVGHGWNSLRLMRHWSALWTQASTGAS